MTDFITENPEKGEKIYNILPENKGIFGPIYSANFCSRSRVSAILSGKPSAVVGPLKYFILPTAAEVRSFGELDSITVIRLVTGKGNILAKIGWEFCLWKFERTCWLS